jgi:DNA-binding response OmpR family regulator
LKKILLIEDDIDTLELVELILRNEGYAVIKANRKVLVEEIIGLKPNLAILDFLLPYGLGTELCLQIKSNKVTQDLPVILYSANTNLKKLAADCHADACLEKPFDIDELVKMVATMAL